MRTCFTILLLLLSMSVRGQDYMAYQQLFNRVDNDLINEHPEQAVLRLDSVARQYTFIYARHCLKALQIVAVKNDSVRAAYWLRRAFLQGVPLWLIRTNELTAAALQYAAVQAVAMQYDSLHRVYLSRINLPLALEIDRLLAHDFHYTRRVNNGFILFRHTVYGLQWIHNNKREFSVLRDLIATHGYPGERLIGLPASINDSAGSARFIVQNGMDIEVTERRVLFMLLHYYSTRRKDINQLLFPQIGTGYLSPGFYGRINDYMDESAHGRLHCSYYVHRQLPAPDTSLNRRRMQIGLNSYEEQLRNQSIRIDRRKKGIINKSIILE